MSKGAYQVGFAKALLRHVDHCEISVVSGASMGLLNAYALSAGKLGLIEAMYRNIDIRKRTELLGQVIFKKLLKREINAFLSPCDYLEIPLVFPVCLMPLYNVNYYWLKGGYIPLWKKYISAAINYPFLCIFPSVINRRFAIDGGAADNIPIYPVLKKGAEFLGPGEKLDLIIALHFDARFDYRKEFKTDVPVLDLDLGICNGFKKYHYDFSAAYIGEMISKAETYGDAVCKKLFGGSCSREEIKRGINEIFVAEHAARQGNVSMDRLVSMLNAFGKAFRSDVNSNHILF